MKFKFNFKLTAFLVSLFISLLIIILGNKNKYCLSFGFAMLGFALVIFVMYNNEKTDKTIEEVDAQIDELSQEYTDLDEEDDLNGEVLEENYAYSIKQLYIRRSKLLKRKKKVVITFYLCAALLVLFGIVGIF